MSPAGNPECACWIEFRHSAAIMFRPTDPDWTPGRSLAGPFFLPARAGSCRCRHKRIEQHKRSDGDRQDSASQATAGNHAAASTPEVPYAQRDANDENEFTMS